MTDSNIDMLINITLILFAYLFGSIASAIVVCKLLDLDDPRTHGSHNPGATNVLRLHGKKAALLTLIGDVFKGIIPVTIASFLKTPDIIIALTGLATFTGHLFPVFFNFRGGKGVATLTGVLLGMNWMLGMLFISTWVIVVVLTRYSSLSALVASALTPVYTTVILPGYLYTACNGLMAVILFWRHRTNIKNLVAGTEDKIEMFKK